MVQFGQSDSICEIPDSQACVGARLDVGLVVVAVLVVGFCQM